MADVYKGIIVKLGVDETGLSSGLRRARKEVSGASADVRRLQRALELDPGNTRLVALEQGRLKDAVRGTREQLDMLRQAESQMASMEGPMTADQRRAWVRIQTDIAECEHRLEGYEGALRGIVAEQRLASSSLNGFGDALERAGERMESVSSGLSKAGSALAVGVTAPLVAAGTASIAAATVIDDSLTSVRKTVDGTEEQYQGLKEAAIEFSKTNAVSASQILDVQALGAQLGFAIDELSEFGEVVSGLDIATNMDAETAATELAQFANITKMAHSETRNYGSAIVDLGNHYATTERDISSMAMRLAAAGTQVGMTEADILGLATALTSMGMEAEAGGTALSTVMSQIDKDVALQSENVKVWADTAGMSAEAFSQAWASKPVEALAALLSNMEAATSEGGNMAVMLDELGITSLRQTDAMKRLAGNSEFLAKAVGTANDAWAENTALQKEVDNRNESISAKFEMLKNKALAVAESVGGPLADALFDALDAAEPLIRSIADGAKAFSEMDEGQQRTVITALALLAAMGPLAKGAGAVLSAMSDLSIASGRSAKKLAEAQAAASAARSAIGPLGDAARGASGGIAGLSGSVGGLAKAGAALKGSGIVALIAGIVAGLAMEGKALYDEIRRQEGFKDATEGLSSALGLLDGSLDGVSASADGVSVEKAAREFSELRREIEDTVGRQAEVARSLKEDWSGIAADEGALGSYLDAIDRLGNGYGVAGGAAELSAEQQGELMAAVAGVNEICGTSVEVIDAQTGALSESNEAIRKNADAWIAQAKAQAAQEKLVDLTKTRMDLEEELADAIEERDKAQRDLNVATEGGAVENRYLADSYSAANAEVERATKAIEENESGQKRLANALQDANRALADNAASTDGAAGSADGLSSSYDALCEDLRAFYDADAGFRRAVDESGRSLESISSYMKDAGVSMGDLMQGVTQFSETAQNEFGEIEAASDISLDKMLENLRKNVETTRGFADNIAALYEQAGSDAERAYIGHLSTLGPEYARQVDALRHDTTGKLAELAAAWAEGGSVSGKSYVDGIGKGIDEAAAAEAAHKKAYSGLIEGIDYVEASSEAKQRSQQVVSDMVSVASNGQGEVKSAFAEVGEAAAAGAAEGIGDGAEAAEAARSMGSSMEGAARDQLGIHSPSTVFADIGRSVASGAAAGVGEGASEAESAVVAMGSRMEAAMRDAADKAARAASSVVSGGFAPGIRRASGDAASAADETSKLAADHLSSAGGDAGRAGWSMAAEHYAGGLSSGGSRRAASAAADGLSRLAADRMSSARMGAMASGQNMSAGFAAGIRSGSHLAESAARMVAVRALAALRRAGGEGSPWRTTRESGLFASEGLALGMRDGERAVARSAAASARAAVAAMRDAMAAMQAPAGGLQVPALSAGAASPPSQGGRQEVRISLSGREAAAGPSYNVYVNGLSVSDDARVRAAAIELADELRWKAGM